MTIIPFASYVGAKICRAKNDVRYYLNAIYIDPEGFIVSTDGHRLFCDKVQTNQPEGLLIDVKGKEPTKFNHAEVSTESKSVSFFDANNALLATLPFDLVDGRSPTGEESLTFNPAVLKLSVLRWSTLATRIRWLKPLKLVLLVLIFRMPQEPVRFRFQQPHT